MRTTAILNLKGGVGKTTTVIHMANILHRDYGARVLVVDCDHQHNLTQFFDADPERGSTTDVLLTGWPEGTTIGPIQSTEIKNYTKVSFGDEFKGYVPKDAIEIQDQLYVLASKKQKDGTYKTSVFVTEDLEHFGEVLNFETQSYINCFEYVDKTFVFGEGGTVENTADNCGNLYTVTIK